MGVYVCVCACESVRAHILHTIKLLLGHLFALPIWSSPFLEQEVLDQMIKPAFCFSVDRCCGLGANANWETTNIIRACGLAKCHAWHLHIETALNSCVIKQDAHLAKDQLCSSIFFYFDCYLIYLLFDWCVSPKRIIETKMNVLVVCQTKILLTESRSHMLKMMLDVSQHAQQCWLEPSISTCIIQIFFSNKVY